MALRRSVLSIAFGILVFQHVGEVMLYSGRVHPDYGHGRHLLRRQAPIEIGIHARCRRMTR